MTTFPLEDSLHRLAKQALDSGDASSISEATEMLKGYRLALEIAEDDAEEESAQIALLTAVTLARRVFLGGVSVRCPAATPLRIPLPLGSTLPESVLTLGGQLGEIRSDEPLISVAAKPTPRSATFHIRTGFAGWRGGILSAPSDLHLSGPKAMPLAPMLAAALAVSEAFSFVSTGNSAIGRRPVGMSLWTPSPSVNWFEPADSEPALRYLPSRLWILGLGHLGQAFMWGLGVLPYANPASASLFLQDFDVITPSTESTSILTDASMAGQKKTRAMASWAERRGFTAAIIERHFKSDFQRQPDEPSVAFCGVDNALARQALDQVGFDFIVEAGLGHGHRDYRTMRLHTLPGPRPASSIWNRADATESVELQPGYQNLLKCGQLDRCGITLLAGKAVGAPFVGAVAATLALSEILRMLHGGVLHDTIDLDLQAVDYRTAVAHSYDFSRLNPGYVLCGER